MTVSSPKSIRGFIVVTIDVDAGWVVGGEERAEDPTTTALRDLNDPTTPRIPATTVAGSLRSHVEKQLARANPDNHNSVGTIEDLMGPIPEAKVQNTDERDGLTASALWVLDVSIKPQESGSSPDPLFGLPTVTRTAINRKRNAPEPQTLATSELVDTPTTATVTLRLDRPTEDLARLVPHIASWTPSFGRGRSIGQGQARVTSVKYGALDLKNEDDLSLWLRHDGPTLVDSVATNTANISTETQSTWLSAAFKFPDGVRIGTGTVESSNSQDDKQNAISSGPDVQKEAETVLVQIGGKHVVPGSSWKGVIRSRFEYILRSVATSEEEVSQLACLEPVKCGECVSCLVFGSTKTAGALQFHTSVIVDGHATKRNRIGIDRFSGGTREGSLYPEIIVIGTSEKPANTELNIVDISRSAYSFLSLPIVRTVILHVLRDLNDGLIGIGSRGADGIGTLVAYDKATEELLQEPSPICREDIEQLLMQREKPSPAVLESRIKNDLPTSETKSSITKPEFHEPQEGLLRGYGEISWDKVAELAEGCTAAWTGFSGASVGPFPHKIPAGATHLWAWGNGHVFRVRIDGAKAIVGALQLDPKTAQNVESSVSCLSKEPVKYKKSENLPTWTVKDGRIDEKAAEFARRPLSVYMILGVSSMEFVSISTENNEQKIDAV